jgi:hypothetical protein
MPIAEAKITLRATFNIGQGQCVSYNCAAREKTFCASIMIKRTSLISIVVFCVLLSPLVEWARAEESAKDTTRAQRLGVYPFPIVYYTPETGVAIGAAALYLYRDSLARPLSRTSDFTFDMTYTLKKQIIAEGARIIISSETMNTVCWRTLRLRFFQTNFMESEITFRPIQLKVIRQGHSLYKLFSTKKFSQNSILVRYLDMNQRR